MAFNSKKSPLAFTQEDIDNLKRRHFASLLKAKEKSKLKERERCIGIVKAAIGTIRPNLLKYTLDRINGRKERRRKHASN